MNEIVQVTNTGSSRAVATTFKNELEVQEHFTRIINNKVLMRKFAFVGGSLLGLALLWPIIQAAMFAGLGLAAIAVLHVSAGAAKRYLPVLWQKVEGHVIELQQREANRHLAALKAEARKNPIEQLQNYLMDKEQELRDYQDFVSDIGAQVKSAQDLLKDRKRQKPDRDYSRKDEAMAAMNMAYEFHLGMAKKGVKALDALREAVDDAKFDWKFGQIGQGAMQQMQALEGKDLIDQILAAESFDSVRTNFHKVFSDIEVQIGKINTSQQIEFGEGMAFDVSQLNIPLKEKQHVSA